VRTPSHKSGVREEAGGSTRPKETQQRRDAWTSTREVNGSASGQCSTVSSRSWLLSKMRRRVRRQRIWGYAAQRPTLCSSRSGMRKHRWCSGGPLQKSPAGTGLTVSPQTQKIQNRNILQEVSAAVGHFAHLVPAGLLEDFTLRTEAWPLVGSDRSLNEENYQVTTLERQRRGHLWPKPSLKSTQDSLRGSRVGHTCRYEERRKAMITAPYSGQPERNTVSMWENSDCATTEPRRRQTANLVQRPSVKNDCVYPWHWTQLE
jgi:hypothetical protein